MGYDVVPGPPPAGRSQRPPSDLLNNLILVAEHHPGPPGARIADTASSESARVLAFNLRNGRRAVNGRPEGTWAFVHGPIEDQPGRFGVWATFTPPE